MTELIEPKYRGSERHHTDRYRTDRFIHRYYRYGYPAENVSKQLRKQNFQSPSSSPVGSSDSFFWHTDRPSKVIPTFVRTRVRHNTNNNQSRCTTNVICAKNTDVFENFDFWTNFRQCEPPRESGVCYFQKRVIFLSSSVLIGRR